MQSYIDETLKEEFQNKLGWIISFRWLSIVAHLIAYPFIRYFSLIHPEMEWFFFSSIIVLILVNLLTKKFKNKFLTSGYLFSQLSIDAFEFGFIMYLTGGTNNPFWPLLFLYAAIGTFALEGMYRLFYAKFLSLILLAMHFLMWQSTDSPILASSTMVLYMTRQTIMIALVVLLTLVASSLDRFKEKIVSLSEQNYRNQRLRAIGALASGFSHEFATPLNSAKIRLSRVLRKYDIRDKSMEADFISINESVQQCEKALKRLNQIGLEQEPNIYEENLSEITYQTVKLWEKNCHTSINVDMKIEDDLLCNLSGVSFCQTIFDLLDNALEASHEKVQIDVCLRKEANSALIEVLDRGEGVPKELKENLGTPFTSSKELGTGLGVYHAKAFIDLVGGAIKYLDRTGGGTVVQLKIPLSNGDL